MKKNLLSIFTSLFIVGCASQPIVAPKPLVIKYSHPSYGIVSLPYGPHKTDRSECRNDIYEKGALINGQLVKDAELLDKYKTDALFYSLRGSEMSLRGAIEGAGGTPLSLQNLNFDPTKSEEYYAEAKRMENDINECMAQLGWKAVEG